MMRKILVVFAMIQFSLCSSLANRSDTWRWIETSFPQEYYSHAGTSCGDILLVTSYDTQACTGHVFRSDDSGESWNVIQSFSQKTNLTSIVSVDNSHLFMMSFDCGRQQYEILKSSDYGDNWQTTTQIPTIDPDGSPRYKKVWPGEANAIYVTGPFLELPDIHLVVSNDFGVTWVPASPFPETTSVSAFEAVSSDHLLIGSVLGQTFESFDGGLSWEAGHLPGSFEIISLKCIESERCLAGIRFRSDVWAREWLGSDWYLIAQIPPVYSFLHSQGVIYAAAGGVFKSPDFGLTWDEMIVESTISVARGIFEAGDGYLYTSGGYGVLRSAEPVVPPTFTPTAGPGTPTYTPHPPTFTPTCSPSPTPTCTGTPMAPTQPPPPTPPCDCLGVTLDHPDSNVVPESVFFLNGEICNPLRHPLTDTQLFVVLEIEDSFWFAPHWSDFPDYYEGQWMPGGTTITIIPEFIWPDNAGTCHVATFWAALTDSTVSELVGDFDSWEFAW